jgi:hypothetical protein
MNKSTVALFALVTLVTLASPASTASPAQDIPYVGKWNVVYEFNFIEEKFERSTIPSLRVTADTVYEGTTATPYKEKTAPRDRVYLDLGNDKSIIISTTKLEEKFISVIWVTFDTENMKAIATRHWIVKVLP